MLNHSCAPNCWTKFDGVNLRVRTLETVPEGAELTISYLDLDSPTSKRQEDLKNNYYFICDCIKCLDDQTNLITTGKKCRKCSKVVGFKETLCPYCQSNLEMELFTKIVAKLEEMRQVVQKVKENGGDCKEACLKLEQLVKMQREWLSPLHMDVWESIRSLAHFYEGMGKWKEVRNCYLDQLPFYQQMYPKIHPDVAIHFLKLG